MTLDKLDRRAAKGMHNVMGFKRLLSCKWHGMPFVERRTAQAYGCRNGAAAGQLDRLELLDLVEVLGQTRSKRRKRMRMRIELVSRLGGVDHRTDTGVGQ